MIGLRRDLDRQLDPLLLPHDVQLERLPGSIGIQDLQSMRSTRRDSPIDVQNDISILQLEPLVLRSTYDQKSLGSAEIPPQIRR